MRYDVGRFRRPMRRSTEGQLASLVSLGDGSTLTLDFTTGILDPRLTFERLSTATFINSSGLVQWADSNLFYNSTWTDANNTPSGWSVGTGTASRSNETRTFTTSASQVYITQTRSTDSGIRYSTSVEVTAVTGSQRVDDVIVALGGSSYQYYFNGAAVSGTTPLTPGIVGLAFTAGAATTTVRVGSGVQGTNTTGAVTLRYPQFEPGTVASRIYRPNSSTTSSYQAPRFDHDPTTLAPKGLLIEGAATNELTNSNAFTSTGWFTTGSGTKTLTPNYATGPDGVANSAWRYEFSQNCALKQLVGSAGTNYANSIWVKSNTGSATTLAFWSGTAAITLNVTTSWTRVQGVSNHSSGPGFDLYNPNSGTCDVLIWGAQREAGSGASSYIPTGASTATRNPDNCSIYDTTTSGNLSWFKTATQGTFYVEAFKRTAGTTFAAAIIGTRANSGQEVMLYQAVGNNWLSLNWGAGEYVTNYSTLSSPFLIKAAVAFSPRTGTPTVADSLVSINGANSALNTTPNVALPFSSDLFCVGARGAASATVPSQNYAEVAIRRIKFFPTAMTAAQLNAMTTL